MRTFKVTQRETEIEKRKGKPDGLVGTLNWCRLGIRATRGRWWLGQWRLGQQ